MKTTRSYVDERLAELAHEPEIPGRRILRPQPHRKSALSWMERHGKRVLKAMRGRSRAMA
jgi:hypothetical protein